MRLVEPRSWGTHIPFAFWLVDALRPGVFVELGTQSGNSYSAFAQAVQMLGLGTACYAVDTWKGDPQTGFYDEQVFEEWSAFHDRQFGSFSRLVRSTFDEARDKFPRGSIDLLHIDGLHTYDAVRQDFESWLPNLSTRAVVLFHDVNVREADFGTWRFWQELEGRYPTFTFLHGHGLGVAAVGPEVPPDIRWLVKDATRRSEETTLVRSLFAALGTAIETRQQALEQSQRAAQIGALESQLKERAATLEDARQRLEVREADARRRELLAGAERGRLSAIQSHLSDLDNSVARLTDGLADLRQRLESHDGDVAPARASLQRIEQKLELAQAVPARRPRLLEAFDLAPLRQLRGRKALSVLIRLSARRGRLAQLTRIARSGLFDEEFYRHQYPDVAATGMPPMVHYVLAGAAEGRSPHPLFDPAFYVQRHPDVRAAGRNPLEHYIEHSADPDLDPHPLFDTSYYLSQVRLPRGMNPLEHFLETGWRQGKRPNPVFDPDWYVETNPDVAASGVNPLVHYVRFGWRERRDPSPTFSTADYLEAHPDVAASQADPLAHYLSFGAGEGRYAPPSHVTPVLAVRKAVTLRPRGTSSPGSVVDTTRTVVCLSHVTPWPPRAGNDYRLLRMLDWLVSQRYRLMLLLAPLPQEHVSSDQLRELSRRYGNVAVCQRDGVIEYALTTCPDFFRELDGLETPAFADVLGEHERAAPRAREVLGVERTFCHDAVMEVVLQATQALHPAVLLVQYVWMSRVLQLVDGSVPTLLDTIDIFSTRDEKVLAHGIRELSLTSSEEAERLERASVLLAIHERDRQTLQTLAPSTEAITVGVDCDVEESVPDPASRAVVMVASDNPMNRAGLRDFVRFAWPRILAEVPDAELLVAGRVSQFLPDETPRAQALGPVDDLRPLYANARVVINPVAAGTGLKIKTIEALSHFRPLVSWPTGLDGVPDAIQQAMPPAGDWFEFAERVVRHLRADVAGLDEETKEVIGTYLSVDVAYRELKTVLARLFAGMERGGSRRAVSPATYARSR